MHLQTLRKISFVVLATGFFFLPVFVRAGTADYPAFENPLTGKAEPLSLAAGVGQIVRGILGVAGVLAVVFIIIGGIRIIAAHGNEDQVKQGMQTVLWAALGLAIAFVGYVLVGAVVDRAGVFFK